MRPGTDCHNPSTSSIVVSKRLENVLRSYQDGNYEGSVLSAQTADTLASSDKEIWRSVRKELEDIGISVAAFNENRALIMGWFTRAVRNGDFEEQASRGRSGNSYRDLSDSDPPEDITTDIATDDSSDDDSSYHDSFPEVEKSISASELLEASSLGHKKVSLSPSGKQSLKPTQVERHAVGGMPDLFEADDLEKPHISPLRIPLISKSSPGNLREAIQKTLIAAIISGHVAMLELLIACGSDINMPDDSGIAPLHQAVQSENVMVVKLLLNHNARPNITDNDGKTPLHYAAQTRNVAVVEMLLEYDAKVDAEDRLGHLALYVPAFHGGAEVAEVLLSHGARPNAKSSMHGWTPLHVSASYGHIEVAKLLLDRGATSDIEITSSGWTPLHVSARYGHIEVAKLLLDRGVTSDTETNRGWTPLHFSAKHGHIEVVKLLLKHSVDIQARTDQYKTPLQLAAIFKRRSMIKLLLRNGADRKVEPDASEEVLDAAVKRIVKMTPKF